MKTKEIHLPSLPKRWADLTMEQFIQIESLSGKFASPDAYLTHCFLLLTGLKPLRYAERWRRVLASIPLIGRLVEQTGRTLMRMDQDYLGLDIPMPIFGQYYRFSGIKNALFGDRFMIEDQEVSFFQKRLRFLLEREDIQLPSNPLSSKRLGRKWYKSYQPLLSDMSWQDYNVCAMYIELYSGSKDIAMLDKFLSAFYRVGDPERVHGKFTPMEIQVVLLFWNNCQRYFKRSFPHQYKESKKKLNKDYMKDESEMTVFLSKEAYTTPTEVREMRAYDALQYLEMNALAFEEKERQIQKMKSKR